MRIIEQYMIILNTILDPENSMLDSLATTTRDRSSWRIQRDSEPATLEVHTTMGELPRLMNKSQVDFEDTENRDFLKTGDLIAFINPLDKNFP